MEKHFRAALVTLLCLMAAVVAVAQDSPSKEQLREQGRQDFVTGKFADAERDFRQLAKLDPTDIFAQMYLGHALFRQGKYAEAIAPYEKARDLEKSGAKLDSTQHRVLTDQLAMAYGISGDLKKAQVFLEEAIGTDPDYPLNYYNLACAYAEQGNKPKMLSNLSLAFEHKENVLKGEQMPDPRSDSSFKKYRGDGEFVALMKKVGYE